MLKQIAEGVFVHQSELLQNNTIIVQGKTGVLLIDPGLTDTEMTCLAKDLDEIGQTVVAGFSTHPDWDHVLWHKAFGQVPRYATAPGAAFMKNFLSKADWKEQAAKGLPPEIASEVPLNLFGRLTSLPVGTRYIPWDGPKVRVIEHSGHAQGHAALFIEERGVLVAGDMLSNVFMPMLDVAATDPIGDYLVALQLFEDIAGITNVVVPGHGSVGEEGEIRARIDLDRTYVEALRDGADIADSRITAPKHGWEWVADIHSWQAQQIAQK